jgi:predicted dehydrogenase
MIHDLDIVLALARAPLKEIRAAGISVLSPKVDIANVRLEFEDGCVANLTASRVSTDKVRKLRLFQPRQYISVDYARQAAAAFTVGGPEGIAFEQLPIEPGEPLKLQFEAFLESVQTRVKPKLNGPTARKTLEIALAVLGKIEEHASVVSETLASGWTP